MKKATRALLILLVLALMIPPSLGFAEAQAGADAFSLTVDNFKVEMAGSPAVDVGLALNLNAGLINSGDRGLWVMDLSGADTNVLTLIAAMENGKVEAYLSNALGGLPYIVEAPMEALAGMAQMVLPLAPSLGQTGDGGPLSGLQQSAKALMEASKDPAFQSKLRVKVQETLLGLTPVEETTIELFGEKQKALMYIGETNFAGLWAALPEIFAADPALKSLYDEAVKTLDESGAFGPGEAFTDLPKRLDENGNDIHITITEYVAGEDQLRLEFAMTALEKGAETGTITLTIDNDSSADRPATTMTLATDIYDSEAENLWVSLESSRSLNDGGEDGYFGLLVKTGDAGGGTVALQLESQRIDATASSAATDWALLSMAFLSAADEAPYAASIRYEAENREENGKPVADGAVTADVLQNGASLMQLSFDTLIQRTSLSEGELFTADESYAVLDVTAMTDAEGQELYEAANTLLNNTLGLLFQVPGVAALLGGTADGGGQ